MATASPLRKLGDKVMCSICLDYLKDPVTINCSHIFCYHCIIKVCESAQQPLYCSLCKTAFKKENIRHVWQMASIVKNIWRMKVDEERQPREDRPLSQRAEQLWGQHLEKLHYYCKDDQQILCVVCQESREHRHHAAVLLEKAAQPYQGKILNHLKILKGDRDRIQNFQSTGEDEIQALLVREVLSECSLYLCWAKFQNHKQDIASVFEQGHQFLREREQYLLEWLEGTEQQLTERRNSHVAKGPEEVIGLETLISELEKKAQQPAVNFCRPQNLWDKSHLLSFVRPHLCLLVPTVRIILNSLTANGYLSVAPNGKSMMFNGLWLNKCQHGRRFDSEPGVLGSKGFTWGKVYWEVKVDRIWWEAEEEDTGRYRAGSRGVFGSRDLGFTGITDGYHSPGYREENEELEEEWSQENGIWPKFCLVGVARESVVRRGFLSFTPEEGFWTLQLSSAGVSICTSPGPFQILSYCPQKIGVALDHDGGKVIFTNARTQEFIYEFSSAFTGRIFPFLWLNCMRSRLMLRP
ncbi:tripartite motif-containing protein 26-like [Bos javanicus]|uniref:tripartite motif-containing protein 26-like n=1 Tax=Bos javanicus TaxID=9906 RepID=UPI002AA7F75A|nr:tripartite motif-containing protein 26-like [Bos javanicus]